MQSGVQLGAAGSLAVNALWAQAEGRALAEEFAKRKLPALILRGPAVQERLLGRPDAYPSADLDLLVRPTDATRVREALANLRFTIYPGTPIFPRLAGHAVYGRDGFAVDIHWDLRMSPLAVIYSRQLGKELWRGSSLGQSGFFEPRVEPLFAYLAAESASSGFSRPQGVALLEGARDHVSDWGEVRRIARGCRIHGAVQRALADPQPPGDFLIDGLPEWATTKTAQILHASPLPRSPLDLIREFTAYRREGVRIVKPRKRIIGIGDLRIERWDGVCGPGTWTEQLVEVWGRHSSTKPRPVLLEVGVGTGALSILAKRKRPGARMYGTDISFRACRNARVNARRHGLCIEIHRGDLLRPLPNYLRGRVDGIVAHLPTLWTGGTPDEPRTETGGVWAPRVTYQGSGGDALDAVRRLLRDAPSWLAPEATLTLSMHQWQWEVLKPEAALIGFAEIDRMSPSPTGLIITLRYRVGSHRTLPSHDGANQG